mgnify:CR=1 FL=1
MYYTGERTFQDMKRWNPLIGKTFYERNPKNDKEIPPTKVINIIENVINSCENAMNTNGHAIGFENSAKKLEKRKLAPRSALPYLRKSPK